MIRRVTGSTSCDGSEAYPSLQPVIANVFEKPSTRIVRPARPGCEATELCSPS